MHGHVLHGLHPSGDHLDDLEDSWHLLRGRNTNINITCRSKSLQKDSYNISYKMRAAIWSYFCVYVNDLKVQWMKLIWWPLQSLCFVFSVDMISKFDMAFLGGHQDSLIAETCHSSLMSFHRESRSWPLPAQTWKWEGSTPLSVLTLPMMLNLRLMGKYPPSQRRRRISNRLPGWPTKLPVICTATTNYHHDNIHHDTKQEIKQMTQRNFLLLFCKKKKKKKGKVILCSPLLFLHKLW